MMVVSILFFLTTSFSEAGGIFLAITSGVRQVAMGSAFIAVADDITAVYYNPGGLAFREDMDIGLMYSSWLPGLYPGMKHIYRGGVVPAPNGGEGFGIGYSYLSTGKTVGMDEEGNEIGRWETYDYALILSYGVKIIKNLGVGASLKYIYSFMAPDWVVWRLLKKHGGDDETLAFDWGVLHKTSIPGLSLGISGQNLGSDGLCYVESETYDPIPSLIRIGIRFNAMLLFNEQLPHFISDLNFSSDWVADLVGERHDIWHSIGAEVEFNDKFSLRSGYFCDKRGKREGITYGCGVTVGSFQIDIASDADIYDFPTSNWRRQINYKPPHLIKK